MGLLIDGVWHDQWYDTAKSGGRFVRQESAFRGQVTADGGAGFPAEAGRYHLYVSLACPWAHRTLIVRALKGLEGAIPVHVVDPFMGSDGWHFGDRPEPLMGARFLHQVYTAAKPDYTGRVTVPVLWDSQTGTIVNNESSEIIRMLNTAFDGVRGNPAVDLYPEPLRAEIDAVNAEVYPAINNGVYRCGFATTQGAYEEAFAELFAALDRMEARLGRRRFLAGGQLTEADVRLFTTLVRFDPVYVGHFKCNRQRIADYPNLRNYVLDIFQHPGVAGTVNFDHIKRHYYESHKTINPTGIVPVGPEFDPMAPHDRARLTEEAA